MTTTTTWQEKDDDTAVTAVLDAAVASSSSKEPTAPVSSSSSNNNNNRPRPRRIVRRNRRRRMGIQVDDDDDRTNSVVGIDRTLVETLVRDSCLPDAYNFEIYKTVDRIMALGATHVALQMPEGLLMYGTVLGDVIRRCLPTLVTQVSILGDVTYGACCVDDIGAATLGAHLLVHYGHSCLVPIQHSIIPCLYVFVEIQIDVRHFVDCITTTLLPKEPPTTTRRPSISLLGTIQFRQGLVGAKRLLEEEYDYNNNGNDGNDDENDNEDGGRNGLVEIPQVKPLSPGEVLGCTSPRVRTDVVVFVADGRFHLESTMIANPTCQLFLRYDPYGKTMTTESYDHGQLRTLRQSAITTARNARTFGIILGTLGRQGNPAILRRIRTLLTKHGRKSFILLLSEISPNKLRLFSSSSSSNNNDMTTTTTTKTTVDAWVQIACPRLSIDWGHCFPNNIPILSPYELFVSLDDDDDNKTTSYLEPYPMDYYSNNGGPWSNYYETNKERKY